MTPNDVVGREPTAQELLRTYVEAVMLAEPLQLRLWKSAGVTLTQMRTLRVLKEHPCCASELAHLAGLSPSSLTRVLDRLAELGYVERIADPTDRRRVAVRLLPAGQGLLSDQHSWYGTAFAAAAEQLSPADRAHFVEAVRSFTASVHAAQERANCDKIREE